MNRIEFWLRMTAYAAGASGVALVWFSPSDGRARPVGFILMIVMFVFFSAGHILRLTHQMRSIHKPLRTVDPWGGTKSRGAGKTGNGTPAEPDAR